MDQPFKINISEEKIKQLQQKLALTVLPDELQDAGRDYGTPLSEMARLLARWKNGYDWRKHETQLNEELPQFKTTINVEGHDNLNIHYVHKRSTVSGAIPLLFVHGWPGSFIEVRKILPLLTQPTDPSHPSFHVVTFSLPGFGFSDAPKKRGFAVAQHAEVGHKLMLALGYHEYVTQGGDWGYTITRRHAYMYGGKYSKAWHTNFEKIPDINPPTLFGSPSVYLANLVKSYTPAEKEGLERTNWFVTKGRGYDAEQSTQPQTLGYGLADSPSGLLGWIHEKLLNWTDEYPWDDDEILTWVSIYWFSTAGPAASVRIYYEAALEKDIPSEPTIPHGVSFFPKELYVFPRLWQQNKYRIFEADHDRGGHFAAHERPEELVGDLRKMFGKDGPAYAVVKGNIGY